MKSSPLSIGLDDCWLTWRIGDTATAVAQSAEDPRVGDDHFADVRATIEEYDDDRALHIVFATPLVEAQDPLLDLFDSMVATIEAV